MDIRNERFRGGGDARGGRRVEHPRPWVRRMLSGRGITPPEKTLYWWSVHLDRFLSFCRKAGPETSAVAERATKAFLTSIAGETDGEKFAAERAPDGVGCLSGGS